MSEFADAAGLAALTAGALLCLASAIGITRLDDFYSRMHAATKPQVLGVLLVEQRRRWVRIVVPVVSAIALVVATFFYGLGVLVS